MHLAFTHRPITGSVAVPLADGPTGVGAGEDVECRDGVAPGGHLVGRHRIWLGNIMTLPVLLRLVLNC